MLGQRLFFFGSLMDPDVLETVTGRAIDQTQLRPGILEGYRCEREVKESYPVLVPCPGGKATVMIAEGLSETDVDRILFYETGEYDLVPFTLDDGNSKLEALGFATGEGIKTSGDIWRLNVWQTTEKAAFLPLASAFMDAYGKMSIPEALKYWDQLTEEFEEKNTRPLKRGLSH
ncbi:gamma-glutamylcyclotransferase family protein [Kiloniella laminariae]|uniref:gamma-glutamylcyclotransferase family protein n=1 Tax=Kiloniella laminariae TaxID=454162 RepID=UPI0003A59AA5|nr:gamma-glutamylcyclotransferase family protein [Kiloniella laminariae]